MFKALLLSFTLAQGADLVTTHYALQRGCVEGNPAFGPHPTMTRIVSQKVGISVGIGTFALLLHKKGYRRESQIILISGIAAGALPALWNLHLHC